MQLDKNVFSLDNTFDAKEIKYQLCHIERVDQFQIHLK